MLRNWCSDVDSFISPIALRILRVMQDDTGSETNGGCAKRYHFKQQVPHKIMLADSRCDLGLLFFLKDR
jgi:hypothetical protein